MKCGAKWADGTPSGAPASSCKTRWVAIIGGAVVAVAVIAAIIGSVSGDDSDSPDGLSADHATAATAIPATLTTEQIAYTQAVTTSDNQARLDRGSDRRRRADQYPVPPTEAPAP